MIEITIKDFLKKELDIPVFLERPREKPASYIVIERSGKSKRNCLGGSIFIIQSYADSLYEAANLNERVKSAVESAIILNDVASVSLNGDYPFTDTKSKKYRYQAVFDIKHY